MRTDAGVAFDLKASPPLQTTLDHVADDVEHLTLLRQDKSYRRLPELKKLKHLWAGRVDQDMLEAIAGLPALEILRIKNISARSLEPLSNLRTLKRLIIHGGGKVADMDWTRGLSPTLEVLFLEGFFRATDITPLGELAGLRTLGLEGGMDRKLDVASLEPLRGLTGLRYLFLAATRPADKSLAPLHGLKHLVHLTCGAYFPDTEFVALKHALPKLQCDWIDMIATHGSIRNGLASRRR